MNKDYFPNEGKLLRLNETASRNTQFLKNLNGGNILVICDVTVRVCDLTVRVRDLIVGVSQPRKSNTTPAQPHPLLLAEEQASQAPAGSRAERNSTEGFKGIFRKFDLQELSISFLKDITLIKGDLSLKTDKEAVKGNIIATIQPTRQRV